MNTLYYGDNLDVLRRYVADESVDLVLSVALAAWYAERPWRALRPASGASGR